jgi:hypothetical protein
MSATDKKKIDSVSGVTDLGKFRTKTIADLQLALDNWLASCGSIANASARFEGAVNWVDGWNSGDTTSIINAGGLWTATVISYYTDNSYTQLRVSYYKDKLVYYVAKSEGVWRTVHQAAFSDDLDATQEQVNNLNTLVGNTTVS